MITKELFESGYTYNEYRELIDKKLANGETTGENQTEEYVDITKMNVHRMNRLDKTIELDSKLTDRLARIPCPVNWLLITEAWCGDASQNVPILNKMAEASPNIKLKLILRDENLDIIDQYLTNGGRAIPKMVVLDNDMKEIATWGPRPKEIQEQVAENKRTGAMPFSEFSKIVQKWYAKNKGIALEKEMMEVLSVMDCVLDE